MTHKSQTFTVADPATFDGDPFEVAERALRQSAAVAGVLRSTLDGARNMARNAEMERQLFATGECDAASFEGTAQARRIDEIAELVELSQRSLQNIARAAGYNPRNPPRA